MPRLSPVYDRFLRLVVATFVGLLLVGCEPKLNTSADHLQTITMLDRQQLPAGHWALSNSIIQLSFCRDRINAALLAEADELRRWRLVGDASSFPSHRQEGLEQLAYFYETYQVRLYQVYGNFGAQWFRVAYPAHESEPSMADVFAKLGRDNHVCYSSLEYR